MQTIKTAVVVVLLLGVCYGAYVALNAPEPELPVSLQDWNEDAMSLTVENGAAVDIPQLSQTPAPDALDSLAPPAVTPPAPAGPTTPSLSLANTQLGQNSNSSKTPDILNSSAPKSATDSADGLGNAAPSLPDLALPTTKEGDSVALPSFPEAEPASPGLPSSLASGPGVGDSDMPSLPSLPSLDDASATAAGGANAFPASPGLLTVNNSASNSSATNNSANTSGISTGITKPEVKSPGGTAQPFAVAREQALKLADEGKLREALAMMSPYFDHIELTHQEHLDLMDLLDALAGEVIYSRRHLLESKYIVSPGDTLEAIANKYRVSPEVLANVNRMGESKVVLAGTELKVFNGPFRGEVDLSKGELTLFLGNLYAGRFPVSLGKEPTPTEGNFAVVERRRDRSYVGADSKFIAANDSRNPYGGYWMHLGNNLCIHGSPETTTPETEAAGCISLAPLDAKEVYTLLTQGAEVVIKR